MRVSDDRYTRDRERFDLALRLIRHEARTFTIRQWTGLSDDRIRKLYRSYVLSEDAAAVLRHRGKSPRQAAFFFRNPEVNFQAAQLASLFVLYGLLYGAGLRNRAALSLRLARVRRAVLQSLRGVHRAAFPARHLVRARLVPAARPRAGRRARHRALRRMRRCAAARPAVEAPHGVRELQRAGSGPARCRRILRALLESPDAGEECLCGSLSRAGGALACRSGVARECARRSAQPRPAGMELAESGRGGRGMPSRRRSARPICARCCLGSMRSLRRNRSELVLLGRRDGSGSVRLRDRVRRAAARPEGTRFAELRTVAALMPEDQAGLLGYARAMVNWRRMHRHCGRCGALTVPAKAGHVLVCTNPTCRHEQFPRIDPAIIVLVIDGDRVLLGRQASWPAGRYSTIAGFVEPGESLEDAVAREVHEETGIQVDGIEYHSSQPWPFPSSLMLGFMARAVSQDIHLRDLELEDARWFTREDIMSGTPLLPPRVSISFRLIEHWFDAAAALPLRELNVPRPRYGPARRAARPKDSAGRETLPAGGVAGAGTLEMDQGLKRSTAPAGRRSARLSGGLEARRGPTPLPPHLIRAPSGRDATASHRLAAPTRSDPVMTRPRRSPVARHPVVSVAHPAPVTADPHIARLWRRAG